MGVTLKSLIFILRNEKMEIKQVASKEIEFDIRKKPSGKVNGVFKDKEENLNRFSYGKGFEIAAHPQRPSMCTTWSSPCLRSSRR